MQAAWRRCASWSAGSAVPRPGDPDRLRRDLPGLRARLLRLLRAARIGECRRPRDAGSAGAEDRTTGPPDGPAISGGLFAGFTACGDAVPRGVTDRSAGRRCALPTPAAGPPNRRSGTVDRRPGKEPASKGRNDGPTGRPGSQVGETDPRRGRGFAPPPRPGRARSRRRTWAIFEAPRYFEALVVGRTPNEVHRHRRPDLRHLSRRLPDERSPRVRGPVRGRGRPGVRALRRLLYCGEWIESHTLHIYLLHAPDFLGYASAIELARTIGPRAARRPAPQEGRQSASSTFSAAARSIRSASASAASPGPAGPRAGGAPPEPRRALALVARPRSTSCRPRASRRSTASPVSSRSATPTNTR